jgi:hypothetical protein
MKPRTLFEAGITLALCTGLATPAFSEERLPAAGSVSRITDTRSCAVQLQEVRAEFARLMAAEQKRCAEESSRALSTVKKAAQSLGQAKCGVAQRGLTDAQKLLEDLALSLQEAMDTKNRRQTTPSDIVKKPSSTQESIIQNLK